MWNKNKQEKDIAHEFIYCRMAETALLLHFK